MASSQLGAACGQSADPGSADPRSTPAMWPGRAAGRRLIAADDLPQGPSNAEFGHGSIFWGASWANSSFVVDKIGGPDSWYRGEGGSSFAKTSDELHEH